MSRDFNNWQNQEKFNRNFKNFFICGTSMSFVKINYAIQAVKTRVEQGATNQCIALNTVNGPFLLELTKRNALSTSTMPEVFTRGELKVRVRREILKEYLDTKEVKITILK